jgi:hypothetical protein
VEQKKAIRKNLQTDIILSYTNRTSNFCVSSHSKRPSMLVIETNLVSSYTHQLATVVRHSDSACGWNRYKLHWYRYVKVKQSHCRPEQAQRLDRGIALPFRDFGGRSGWVVSTTLRPLYPLDRPGTHCTEGWVGPRAGLDVCEKSRSYRDSFPGPSSP